MERPATSIGLIALGAAATVSQAALLREAMAALGGSELAWGAVLALWLTGTGAGAWFGAGRRGARAGLLPFVVLLLAFAGVLLLRAAPAVAGLITGEAAATWRLLWLWCLAILPAAATGGTAFSVLAARLQGAGAAASAYAMEAFGAFLGGALFTFALAGTGSASALVAVAGLVVAARLLAGRRWAVAAAAVVIGVGSAGGVGGWVERTAWAWSGRMGELREWKETREQRLEIAGTQSRSLYADGRLVASYPDPWRIAPRAHLLMLLHPEPRHVLAVGALADGSLPVMLRHPVEELTVVEEDPEVVAVVAEGGTADLRAALKDPRVRVLTGDPMRAVARSTGGYDLVLLLDGDPTTLRRNRTRTVEFFDACREKLDAHGLLVVQVGVSDTYLGGAGGRLLATVAATLHSAGLETSALPGEHVLLLGSPGSEPARVDSPALRARWASRGLSDESFDEPVIDVLVDTSRIGDLAGFLASAPGAVNTAGRPRAVLLAAALTEGRGFPALVVLVLRLVDAKHAAFWVAVVVLGGFVLVAGATGRGLGFVSGSVLGSSSMAWWLLLLATWQSRYGSVYAEVGLLSGLFMLGVASGAAAARGRRFADTSVLAVILALATGVSGLLAGGAALRFPHLLVVPLLIVSGALTGAGFPAVARLNGGAAGGGAGRAFGADEIGAGLAALGVGLIAIPWVGMFRAAAGLAVLQGAAVAGLWLSSRRAA